MGQEPNFGTHDEDRLEKILFGGLKYIQYGPRATIYVGGNYLYPN